jgi:hypothetical protein
MEKNQGKKLIKIHPIKVIIECVTIWDIDIEPSGGCEK